MTESQSLKASKLPLLLIFFTVFIDLVGFGVIIPLLPTYAEKFGAGGLVVGLLLMSYSLMQFIFAPMWGKLSDNVGRRPILLVSLGASCLGYLIWGFAGSLLLLFASRIVAGIGNANLAVAQAYIADVTAEEDRARGMGIVMAAFGLGFVLGPAIGGWCAGFGYNVAGFVAAGFSALDLVLTYFLLPEPPERSRAAHERFSASPSSWWSHVRSEKLRVPMAIFFLSTFAFANMEATLVLLTERKLGFTALENGWMFTYIGLVMVLVQGGLIGRLSRRFGERNLVIAGSLLTAAGLVLTPCGSGWILLYLALAFLAVGSGLNTPANQSILSRLAGKEEVGAIMGIGQSLSTLGRILGPLVGGFAFQYLGYASPYLIGALAMVVVVVLGFSLPRLNSPAGNRRPATSQANT